MIEIEVKRADSPAPAATRASVPVGIVRGYFSTFQPDEGGIHNMPDQFMPGCWLDSIQEHRARGGRPVRLRWMHDQLIGAIPIETVREDSHGLFGEARINLGTQLGREVFDLVKQGALSDFSVGYTVRRDRKLNGVRQITQALLGEVSIVDEPGNRGAKITAIGPGDASSTLSLERPAPLETAAASMAGLLDSLRAARDELRQASEWSSPASTGEAAAVKSILANLRGAAADLREFREASAPTGQRADDRAALRAILDNLNGARDDLRESTRAATRSPSPERVELLGRLAGLETRLRLLAA